MSEAKKTHWRKCDKSDYLGACDLENGDINVTIKKVEIKQAKLRGKSQEARVATFKENIKPMIVNVACGKVLLKFTKSKFVEDWSNVPVTIFVEENVRFGAEITEGLRFRGTQPRTKKEILNEKHPKWKGACENLKNGMCKVETICQAYEVSDADKNILTLMQKDD